MDDAHEPVVLVDRQVLDHLSLIRLAKAGSRRLSLLRVLHEEVLDPRERGVTSLDQVGQVLQRWRLILDEDQ